MTESPAERRYRQGMELNDAMARAEARLAQQLRDAAGAHPMRYAWCWSHGALHKFPAGQDPWCTATWVWLDGTVEEDALTDKQARYGDARFLHQLPADQQLAIIQRKEQP